MKVLERDGFQWSGISSVDDQQVNLQVWIMHVWDRWSGRDYHIDWKGDYYAVAAGGLLSAWVYYRRRRLEKWGEMGKESGRTDRNREKEGTNYKLYHPW